MSEDPSTTAAAVAQAQHATLTTLKLQDLEAFPAVKQKPQLLTSMNWSQASSKPATDIVQVAPIKQQSAWGNSLLVNRNPSGFPQTLPEPYCPPVSGWKIIDSNVDELDPWERSQNPSMIPRRPPEADPPEAKDAAGCADEDEDEEYCEEAVDLSEMFCQEYTMTGRCSSEMCPCIHGGQCPCCGYFCLHPTDADMRAEHESACWAMYEEMQRLQAMQAMECAICLEPVLLKEDASARCFGLLDCEHCFCLTCIRNWRENTFADIDAATRTCPTCRKKSHFVTPSPIWPATEDEKRIIIEEYKNQLGLKHCKHFDHGRGTCPFGTSCFYRHEYLDGSLQDRTQLPDVRFVTNSDGEFKAVRDNTLASFLDVGRHSRLFRSRTRR